MTARLSAAMLVSAMIRQVEIAGGHAMVIAKGDAVAGAILIQLADRGIANGLRERQYDLNGGYRWAHVGPDDPVAVADYLARRRRSDPDLWIVELDSPEAERIAMALTDDA